MHAHTHARAQIIVAVAINKERPQLPPDAPPRMAALIQRCWAEEPGARPTVNELRDELEQMVQVRWWHGHVLRAAAACACGSSVAAQRMHVHAARRAFVRVPTPLLCCCCCRR